MNKIKKSLKSYRKPMLIRLIKIYCSKNEEKIYELIHDSFYEGDCNQKEIDAIYDRIGNNDKNVINLENCLVLIAKLSDYDFLNTFNRIFYKKINCFPENVVKYSFNNSVDAPFPNLLKTIELRTKFLKENNLYSRRKSNDHNRYKHFRYHLKQMIDGGKHYILRLLETNSSIVKNYIYICPNHYFIFKDIINYILDENIIPDPFFKEITVDDPINPDIDFPRKINKSGKIGGFWHIVYLTAEELKVIFDKSKQKEEFPKFLNSFYNYIKYHENKEQKFYLFVR